MPSTGCRADKIKNLGKRKVLFLCTQNSARSQMAEGLLGAIYGDRYDAYSAGIEATSLDPRAEKTMSEIGIDISGQTSKGMDEYRGVLFDLAVTVCDKANESCPICGVGLAAPNNTPAAKKVIHRAFKDPALAGGSYEKQLNVFRQVRDEMRDWIVKTFMDYTV
jgi:arsenate reductase